MGKAKRKKSSPSFSNRKSGSNKTSPELNPLSGSELICDRARLRLMELHNTDAAEQAPTVVTTLNDEKNGATPPSSPAIGALRLAPLGMISPSNSIKVLNKSSKVLNKSSETLLPAPPCPVSSNFSGLSPETSLVTPAKLCADLVAPIGGNLMFNGAVAESSTKSIWNDDERDLGVPISKNVDSDCIDSGPVSSPSVSRTLGDTDSLSVNSVLKAMDNAAHLLSPQSVNSSASSGKQAISINVNDKPAANVIEEKVCDGSTVPMVGNLGNGNTGSNLANNIENVDARNVKNDAIFDFWLSKNVPAPIVELIRKMSNGKYLNLRNLCAKEIPYSEIKIAMNIAAYFTRKAYGLDRDAIDNLTSKVEIEHAVNVLEHVTIEVGVAQQNVANEGATEKSSGKRDIRPSLPKNSAWNKRLHPMNRVLDNSRKIERHPTNVIDVQSDINKQESILIGHFVGKFPPRKDFEVVRKGWNVQSQVITHASSWIIIKFGNEHDLEKVLNGGPYIINGISLLLRRLPKLFNFRKEDICVLPIWVRLPNLPLELYNKICIGKIAQNLGEPLFIDELTETPVAYNFARALVEIDVSEATPEEIQVPFSDGTTLLQKVIYEQFQGFCKVCKCLGHHTAHCKVSTATDPPNIQDTSTKPNGAATSTLSPPATTSDLQDQATGEQGSALGTSFEQILAQIDHLKEQLLRLVDANAVSGKSKAQDNAQIDATAQILAKEAPISAQQNGPARLDSSQAQTDILGAEPLQENAPDIQIVAQQVQSTQAPDTVDRIDSQIFRTPQKGVGTVQEIPLTVAGPSSTKKDEGKKKKKRRNKTKNDAIIGLPAIDSGSSLKPF